MKYNIEPLKGAGPFTFGMTPDQVRQVAGVRLHSFKRTPASTHACDHFPDLGMFANYTAQGRLEAIEFATPAEPMFHGDSLLGMGFAGLTSLLEKHDHELEIEPDSIISHRLGISAYAPVAKENEQERIESVMVFQKGYYD